MHTIEAVFLVPLAFVLSLYLLFTGIILYDRTAADYALEGALIRGGERSEMSNDELLHYVEDEFMKLLSGRLLIADGELSVTVKYDNISAEYRGSVNLPRLPLLTSSPGISAEIKASGKITRLRRSKICRAVSALKHIDD
ncbi:MAG: hypothetical protein K6B44_02850 [Lachnospiraceae bacterium]|nr:hypothetical protein [Lachnospiraceae bacterium]